MNKYILILAIFMLSFLGSNFANALTSSAADCGITRTLRMGSSGNDVACFQERLGIYADGKFGPMTKVAVLAWQKDQGLIADGIFGIKSRMALATRGNSGSLPEGCEPTFAFSSITGKPCFPSKNDTGITIINPAILPQAQMGVFYVFAPKAVGGLNNQTWNNYNWSITTGVLPAGLDLVDGSVINGIPTKIGKYIFSLTASNGTISVTKEFTLTVGPAINK